jgi:hypothetical protein
LSFGTCAPNKVTMKLTSSAIILLCSFLFVQISSLYGQGSNRKEKAWIEFSRLDLRSDGSQWLVATMQIIPKEHPDEKGALNEDYIDEVKIDLYLCFKNKAKEKKIYLETRRKAELKNILDYYHASVEMNTIEVTRSAQTLSFLFPLAIAKRDGFDKETSPYGQVVDISIGGVSIQKALHENAKNRLSEPIIFEGYKDQSILQSFKQECISNSASNQGILIPAHLVNPAYLKNASSIKFPKPSQ